jgi:hypothetical protein
MKNKINVVVGLVKMVMTELGNSAGMALRS